MPYKHETSRFESVYPHHKEDRVRPLKRSPQKEPNDTVGILGVGSITLLQFLKIFIIIIIEIEKGSIFYV